MKLNRLLPLAALLAAPHSATAQAVIDNGPELIVSGLFDSGPVPDVAIVDKLTGQVRTGLNGGSVLSWSGPLLSGASDISAVTSGKLGLPLNEGLMLTSRAAQKLVRVSPLDASSPPAAYNPALGAPASTVALDYASGASPVSNTNGLWLATGGFGGTVFPEEINLVTPQTGSLSGTAGAVGISHPLFSGQRVRMSLGGNLLAAWASDRGVETRVLIFESMPSGIPALPWRPTLRGTFSGLPPRAQFAHEHWLASGQSVFVFFAPGDSRVWHAPGSLASITVTANVDTGTPIAFLTTLNAAGAQGFIAFPQSPGPAKYYTWNGAGFTLKQSIAPPSGGRWTGALPGAGLMLLHGPAAGGGTSGWQHWPLQGNGEFAFSGSGNLPALTLASAAHVFSFTQEPFVSPLAAMTSARRVADWTSGPPVLPGSRTMQVNRETYGGAAGGLGSPVSFNAGTAPAGSAWMLTNQYASDTSVAALSSETIAISQPTVSIRPPARHREMTGLTPAVSETLAFSASAGALVSWRSSPSQPFQLYNPASPPVIAVTALPQSTTVEYFASNAGVRSRLQLATYTFGTAAPLSGTPSLDADLNGLADAWEAYYGLTDPNGDPDGDGLSNLTEQNTGSDPLGPCLPGELPDLTLQTVGTVIRLHLTRPVVPGEILEQSTDLNTWQAISLPVNATSLDVPAASQRGYYRLRK